MLAVIVLLVVIVAFIFYARFEANLAVGKVVGEAFSLASRPREAVGVACANRTLAGGLENESLGLAHPEEYFGHYVAMVRVKVEDNAHAAVTVVLKEVEPYNFLTPGVSEGETLEFKANCASNGITWTLSGTAPDPMRQRAQMW